MAIKGKSRTKSRPKQVARAPRREPVVVKPPLFQRRWLQLTAAFILGVLAMSIVVWVSHGVHRQRAEGRRRRPPPSVAAAARAGRAPSRARFAKVGTATQQGLPPDDVPGDGRGARPP